MPGLELIDPRKMWKNYVIALTAIFVLITGSHFAGIFVGGDAARMASDINVSGRQRMLSQRIMFFATVYQMSGYRNPELAKELRSALDLFEKSHEALTDTSASELHPKLTAHYFGETEDTALDRDVRTFLKDAHILLDGQYSNKVGALLEMKEIGPTILLRKLNTAVSIYEEIARESADLVHNVSLLGYFLAIAVLIGETLVIFRPSHRTIVAAFSRLEESNVALKKREADAFAALEDAEEAWAEADEARQNSEQAEIKINAHKTNIAYELSAPIEALRTKSEQLMALRTPETRETIKDINSLTDLSARVLQNLINAGDPSQEPNTVSYDLASVIQQAVRITGHEHPNIAIKVSGKLKDCPVVQGDPIDLFRSILHVLREAASMTGSGVIDLQVTHAADGDDLCAIFEISHQLQPGMGGGSRLSLRERTLAADPLRHEVLQDLMQRMDGAGEVEIDGTQRSLHLAIRRPIAVRKSRSSKAGRKAAISAPGSAAKVA